MKNWTNKQKEMWRELVEFERKIPPTERANDFLRLLPYGENIRNTLHTLIEYSELKNEKGEIPCHIIIDEKTKLSLFLSIVVKNGVLETVKYGGFSEDPYLTSHPLLNVDNIIVSKNIQNYCLCNVWKDNDEYPIFYK